MKTIHSQLLHLLCWAIAVAGLFSCSDLLDKQPLTEISDTNVWSDPALVEAFVNARYNRIRSGWFEEPWISSLTDETYMTWSRGCEQITQGYISPSDLGSVNWGLRQWDNVWGNISACNQFFENIDRVEFTDEAKKTRLKGEVRFIRALMYHDLVARWGGMPLITAYYTLNDREEIIRLTRSTYKECIDFIVDEADRSASELPATYSGKDQGRATRIAALALKSRVLLYAASDLVNVDVKSELTGYASPEPNRWNRAAEAAEACLGEALDNGYALFDDYGDDVKTKYTQLFLQGGHAEIFFDRQHTSSSGGASVSIDQINSPNGYAGWGGNTPTGEFVDAFEMADGTPFSWEKYGDSPWENRDQRLYATVLCDGDAWKSREVEVFFHVDGNGELLTSGGLDTRYGIESHNTSITGYNMRKFIDESYVDASWNFSSRNWIWFRLAEQYLNLAEARFMEGKEAEARTALNVIRQRARMPAVTASGEELLAGIRHERRIELCFEEHRYFDLRRWKTAAQAMNYTSQGVEVHKWPDGHKTYHPGKVVEIRKFVERMYWLPIPQSEIDKCPNLEQNPGY
ncbi:MAG: RagB/SusD family nutrient uptake outer membrane protein [Tannerellaceae bacterium]|jgi:hypothetical protein|nr:RagB/SusD family nutrient uptake outer membrane protein [Tannerellaceae bacterium]